MNYVKVLLVDDSEPWLKTVATWLPGGVPRLRVVGQASTGCEALAETMRLHPDLVLMDIAMPEMDGIEATRQLKARPDAPRVVILTLYAGPAYQAEAEAAGADGFLGKAALVAGLPPMIEGLFPDPLLRLQA
jgi:CheY-like chemotaxis protein